MALVARCLNKVQKICEKQFVHGRYLKNITIVYEGEDTDRISSEHKTVTFVALPIFTTECPRRHISTREDEVHPVRALLQSRYRLESTKRRDKEQVITKTSSRSKHWEDGHVIHVPQIWALVINKQTIITCAPLKMPALRGDNIKLMSYADARLNEATWSVHFTDAQGHIYFLPLRFCKTYFGLVKQIAEDCLHDEFGLVRDQLLKNGPLYKLIADDDVPVTAESWIQMVEKERTEVIRLRLVDNETRSNRLLVTYCDPDGNEIECDSDASSDTSSVFSGDGDGSDTTATSSLSVPSYDAIAPAVEKLRQLQAKLAEAKVKNDPRKVEAISDRLIPHLEDQILGLTAADLGLNRSAHKRHENHTRMVFPDQYDRRRGSAHQLLGSPMTDTTDDENLFPKSNLRARSGSRTRSTLYRPERSRAYRPHMERSRSAYDISSPVPRLRGRSSRSRIGDADNSSRRYSGSHHLFQDYAFPPSSGTRSRPQSLKLLTYPSQARSRWDIVRSRVVSGTSLSTGNTPVSPSNDIYYQPSDKQLARSRWEFLRNQILAGADLGQNKDTVNEKQENEPTSPRVRDKLATAMRAFAGDSESSPSQPHSETVSSNPNNRAKSPVKEMPRIAFEKLSQEGKPRLKRLINMARKESASLPKLETLPAREEKVPPNVATGTQDLPIFLWSTAHKPADIDQLARIPHVLAATGTATTDRSLSEKPIESNATRRQVDEFYLYTILSGMHNHLKKPKKISPHFANLYDKTVAKSLSDLASFMATSKAPNSLGPAGVGSTDNVSPTFVPSRIKFEEANVALNRLNESRSKILMMASKILYAFVPEGYDAEVVSKYWGAMYQILQKDVCSCIA